MQVFEQLEAQLQLLEHVVGDLPEDVYTSPIPALYHASIGEHTRHVIEILQCTIDGHAMGVIDYHHRDRDLALARDVRLATARLSVLRKAFLRNDKAVNVVYSDSTRKEDQVLSTYYRELQYNVEHAIHHMALIKVAFFHLGNTSVPENFGLAYATIAFRGHGA